MFDTALSGDIRPSRFFVFMGVCGAGKTTVAQAVAEILSGVFLEADDLHPPENVKAMSDGRPLTDEQRWPWLQAVCDAALSADAGRMVMVACSALARRYRDFIRARLPNVIFVHLAGSPSIIRARMARRQAHFMPPTMLESQLATLEPPRDETDCYSLGIDADEDAVIEQAVAICRRHMIPGHEETTSLVIGHLGESDQRPAGRAVAAERRQSDPGNKQGGGKVHGKGQDAL